MQKLVFLSLIFFSTFVSIAQTVEVSFTLDDRDRLIRLEEEQKYLRHEMNEFRTEIREIRADMREIRADMENQFYVIMGGMFVLIGFIIWDRRTTLSPIIRENKALKKAFIKLAEKSPDAKEALKYAAII